MEKNVFRIKRVRKKVIRGTILPDRVNPKVKRVGVLMKRVNKNPIRVKQDYL